MKQLHVFNLAFNSLNMVSETLRNFEAQRPDYLVASKTLVDQHWPLVDNPMRHAKMLMDLCEQYGWLYVRPSQNRGVGPSYDWVIKELSLGEQDALYCLDNDERVDKPKYLDAAMDVLNNAPECFTVQMNQARGEYLTYPRDELTVGRTPVLKFHQTVAWANGAFSVAWLKRIGGFLQPHPVYGHCESAIDAACRKYGGRFYILRDFYNTHLEAHPVYSQWKHACAAFQTTLPFADWLKARGAGAASG